MKLGLVTCSEYPNLPENEKFLLEELQKYGIQATPVIWSENIDWRSFDALLIRSVWDYHIHYEKFINWLSQIKSLGISVHNSVDLIIDNSNKNYLKDLESKGVSIVPTELIKSNTVDEVKSKMEQHSWNQAVLKPTISATAYHTHLIRSIRELDKLKIQPDLDYILQPFIPEIKQGEYSIIFFNGQFSHAVLKKPKAGDFRVQSDFGGSFEQIEVSHDIIKQAEKSLLTLNDVPLYSRVDGVIIEDQFVLMELELIEPELFLLTQKLKKTFIEDLIKTLHN